MIGGIADPKAASQLADTKPMHRNSNRSSQHATNDYWGIRDPIKAVAPQPQNGAGDADRDGHGQL
jgi:hypothetical protein